MTRKQSITNRNKMMKLTPEQRKKHASYMVSCRWKKTTKKQRIEYSQMMLRAKNKKRLLNKK